MSKRIGGIMRGHSPATIVACVALFFSLGGVGYAAASHYRIWSIHQIKPSVRRELRGRQGKEGLRGPDGPQGPAASPVAPGWNGHTTFGLTRQIAVTSGAPSTSVTLNCASEGGFVVSGGYEGATNVTVVTNDPESDSGWTVTAQLDPPATTGSVEADALCGYTS